MLAAAPVCFFLAHLLYGVDQTLSAQWFVGIVALLAAGMLSFAPRGSFSARRAAVPLGLFLVVIAVVSLSMGGVAPVEPARLALSPLLPRSGTINTSATLLEISKLGGLACAFLLGHLAGIDRLGAKTTVRIVLMLGCLYAVAGLVLFFAGAQALTGQRLSVGFLSFNSAALVFGILVVIATGEGLSSIHRHRRRRMLLSLGQICLFGVCLCLTASRMGIFATFSAAATLIVWDGIVRRNLTGAGIPMAATASVGLMIVLISGNQVLGGRLAALQQDITPRQDILVSHLTAIRKAPIGGYGLGSFTEVNNLVMTQDNFGSLEPVRAMHNVYLQWLEEGGVLASVPMFILIAWLISTAALQASRRARDAGMLRGLIAASMVVLLMGISDFGLQVPSIAAFWSFLLGLTFALARLTGSTEVDGRVRSTMRA